MKTKAALSDVKTLRARARKDIEGGAVTAGYSADRTQVLKLLNEALATEIVCVLRYRRHHFMARGIDAKSTADEFLVHSNEEQGHADKQTIEMIDVAMADIRRAPRLMTERTLMITSRSTSNSRARTAFTRRSSCSPMPSRTWRNRKIKQTRAGYWRPAPARRAALLRAIQWAR